MQFLPNGSLVGPTVWLHDLDSNETLEEKARWELYKNATPCFEQILEPLPTKKKKKEQQLYGHLHQSKTDKTCGTLMAKEGRNHLAKFSNELLRMDTPVLSD